MKELSMNILDILQNSANAGSNNVLLCITEDTIKDIIEFSIKDDGKGMDETFLASVFDPFVTTSSTKKVGLGLPFLKIQADMCNGEAEIKSKPGEGTFVRFSFQCSHVDRPPMGDLAGTLTMMFTLHQKISFRFSYDKNGRLFELDTSMLKELMQDVPLNHPKIAKGIYDFLFEELKDF